MHCPWLVVLGCGSFAWCNVIATQKAISWVSKASASEALQNYERYSALRLQQNSTDSIFDFYGWLQDTEIAYQIKSSTEELMDFRDLPESVHMFWNVDNNHGVTSFGMTSSEVKPLLRDTISHNAPRNHLSMLVIWQEKHQRNFNTMTIRNHLTGSPKK